MTSTPGRYTRSTPTPGAHAGQVVEDLQRLVGRRDVVGLGEGQGDAQLVGRAGEPGARAALAADQPGGVLHAPQDTPRSGRGGRRGAALRPMLTPDVRRTSARRRLGVAGAPSSKYLMAASPMASVPE